MAEVQNFYCWVKLSKRQGTAAEQSAEALSREPTVFNGGIPPHVFNGGIPPHVLNGGIPPGAQLGGYFSSAWWALDVNFSGVANSDFVVAFQPVAGTRDAAIEWLKKHPEWLDASVDNYFLMIFSSASHGVGV